jgi:Recombinase
MTKTSRRNRAAVARDALPLAARSYLEGFKKRRQEAHDCAVALAQHDRADFTSDELERILPATVAVWNENAQRFGCLLALKQTGPITLQFVPLCDGAGGQALGQLLTRLTSPDEPRAVKLMLDLFLMASTTDYDEQKFRENAKGRDGEWNRRVRKTDFGGILRDVIDARKKDAEQSEDRQARTDRQFRLRVQTAHDAIERDIRADPDCKDIVVGWPHRFRRGKMLAPLSPRAATADGTASEMANAPKSEYKDAAPTGVDMAVPDEKSDIAPVIEELRAAGAESMAAIASGLNDRGIPTTRGGNWSATQVARVLARGSGIDSRMRGQERERFGDLD